MKSVLRCVAVFVLLALPGAAFADFGQALQIIGTIATALGFPQIGYPLIAAGTVYGGVEARKKAKAARAAQVRAFNEGLQGRAITLLTAEPPHRCVYGRCITGGDVMAIFTTDKTGTREDGSTYTKADALQHLVIHLQTRQAQAIHEVYIDGVPVGAVDGSGVPVGGAFRQSGAANKSVTFTGSVTVAQAIVEVLTAQHLPGDDVSPTPVTVALSPDRRTITATPSDIPVYVSYTIDVSGASVRVRKLLGTADQAADSYLSGLVPDKWTSAHRGRGMAGLIVTLDLEDSRFQGGIPNITADMSGALLYDPRKDSTVPGGSGTHRADNPATWEWSDTASLCKADFLASEMGYGVDRLLDIDPAYQIAAANACDVTITLNDGAGAYTGKRYTCNGAFNSDMSREKVLQDLEDCMAGVAVPAGQWLLMAGAWTPPVLDLDDADLAGSIEVIQSDTATDDLLNSARATYIAAGRSQPEDAKPPYTNPVLVTADQGVPLWGSFTFPFTNSNARVRNLLRIKVERKRSGLVIQYPAKLKAWGLQVGMRVRLSNRTLQLDRKLFRVTDRQCGHKAPVTFLLQEDAPEIWDEADAAVADPTPNTGLPDPYVVAPLSGLAATSGTATLLRTADGTVVPQVVLSWSAITSAYVAPRGRVLLRYRRNADLTWRELPSALGDATGAAFTGVQEDDNITIEARVRNTLGQVSAPVYVGHVVQGKSTPASAVTGFSGVVSKGRIPWVWTPCPDADYGQTEVRAADADWGAVSPAPLFRGTANGWQEVVAATGTFTRYARHIDLSGNPSTSSASASVVVAAEDLVQDGEPGDPGDPGADGTSERLVFRRAATMPDTPTGDGLPSGWADAPPAADGAPLWMSKARQQLDGTTIGSWSAPVKIDATVSASPVPFGSTVVHVEVNSGVASNAYVRFNTDGTISTRQGNGGSYVAAGNWYLPTTSGIGSSYRLRTVASGDALAAGGGDEWQALSSERIFRLEQAVSPSAYAEKNAALQHYIAGSSSDVPLAQGVSFLSAAYDPAL
jgi:hypothetical protein